MGRRVVVASRKAWLAGSSFHSHHPSTPSNHASTLHTLSIPSAVIHVLPEELNGRLGPILLNLWRSSKVAVHVKLIVSHGGQHWTTHSASHDCHTFTPWDHLRHVEIVHKNHRVLPDGGAIDSLAALVELSIDDVLQEMMGRMKGYRPLSV